MLTAIFKMDNQQGPTVWHRELCSVLCRSLDEKGVEWRMDTYSICRAEALLCSPRTITTLVVNRLYTSIQNKKYKYKKKIF